MLTRLSLVHPELMLRDYSFPYSNTQKCKIEKNRKKFRDLPEKNDIFHDETKLVN